MSHLWFSFWWNFLVYNPSLTRFLWLGHSWERLSPWRQSSASAISIGWAGKFCAYAHQLIMWSNTSKPPNWKSRKCKMLLIQLAQQHCSVSVVFPCECVTLGRWGPLSPSNTPRECSIVCSKKKKRSDFKACFLMNAYCFPTIIRLKDHKSNHWESGTIHIHFHKSRPFRLAQSKS